MTSSSHNNQDERLFGDIARTSRIPEPPKASPRRILRKAIGCGVFVVGAALAIVGLFLYGEAKSQAIDLPTLVGKAVIGVGAATCSLGFAIYDGRWLFRR